MLGMTRRQLSAALVGIVFSVHAAAAAAADATVIEARIDAALVELERSTAGADMLIERARGVLIMPNITKAGFIVGGQYGEGALQVAGETVSYYSLAGGSLGFQAGVETFSQALLFMTDESLARFRETDGWEAGIDAEVTLLTAGFDAGADTTITNEPIIGIIFGQNGLLAGASLQGAKYTQIER